MASYQDAKGIYWLQGRDDNKGVFLPSQEAIGLGKKDALALKG